MADALSISHAFLSTLKTKVFGLEHIKDLYASDSEFSSNCFSCELDAQNGYFRHNGYLPKEKYYVCPKDPLGNYL